MSKVLAVPLAAALVVAAASGAVAANTSSWQFNLSTTVPGTCSIQNGHTTGALNAVVGSPGTSPTTINFSQAVNPTTAFMNAANATWAADAMCNNFATQATLASQAGTMSNPSLPTVVAGAFLSKVDYTVVGNWASVTLIPLIANKPPQTPTTSVTQIGGAINGPLQLVFQVPASGVPLIAGNYSDVMTLTLFTNP
jgi:hypothetical protein